MLLDFWTIIEFWINSFLVLFLVHRNMVMCLRLDMQGHILAYGEHTHTFSLPNKLAGHEFSFLSQSANCGPESSHFPWAFALWFLHIVEIRFPGNEKVHNRCAWWGITGLTKILSPDEFNMREGVKSIKWPSVLERVC